MGEGDPRFAGWMLDSMSSGVLALDERRRVAELNQGACRVLGLPGDPDRLRGRDGREVLAAQPEVLRLLLGALRGRGGLSRAELALEPAAGRAARAMGFTLSPVRDGEGRIRGAAMVFRDLAPIERSDEQLRLRDRLAALGQMAAGLAHEIRNPLAGMEVLAGLLRRRLSDRPEEAELVNELVGELRALADTVTASLDFVRPLSSARAPVDPEALLEEALATAVARIPFAGEVERRYAPSLPALSGDEDQLRTVFSNLILNALEAMGAEAQRPARLVLCLETRAVHDAAAEDGPGTRELVVGVSDTGPGVGDADRERIFYPFFTTRQSGSGVGLANAQKIVASHGGVIELESRPGAGCTFRVHLPAAGPEGADFLRPAPGAAA